MLSPLSRFWWTFRLVPLDAQGSPSRILQPAWRLARSSSIILEYLSLCLSFAFSRTPSSFCGAACASVIPLQCGIAIWMCVCGSPWSQTFARTARPRHRPHTLFQMWKPRKDCVAARQGVSRPHRRGRVQVDILAALPKSRFFNHSSKNNTFSSVHVENLEH